MKKWLEDFDLFLFDFDGLLADTEHLYYRSCVAVCAEYGCQLPWDLERYLAVALADSTSLQKQVYADLPQLYAAEPDWSVLRAKKTERYLQIIEKERVNLMPGVENFLRQIMQKGKELCVVTNSQKSQIEPIKRQHAILQQIPHWLTREYYERPKPFPDSYLQAIQLYGKEGSRIIGFEDSPRGLKALLQTPAAAVYVNTRLHPAIKEIKKSYESISSFQALS